WEQLSVATGSPLKVFTWVWLVLWISALATVVFVLFWRRDRLPDHVREMILFAGTSLVLGTTGFACFLKLAARPTHRWYYMTLIAFAAVCLDAMLFAVWRWARAAALILAALTVSATLLFELSAVICRQTNVDLIAAQLTTRVTPNDYVIVHPWYCGVSF